MLMQRDMPSTESTQRVVKLLCPSLAKVFSFKIWDDEKIDLGSIARAFGLDPSTLMLNGHFISRGVDLIACSVTWKSLLSFFTVKGFSTGKDDMDALIVEGKLTKVGKKRGHDPVDGLSRSTEGTEKAKVGCSTGVHLEIINSSNNKRLRNMKSGDCSRGLSVKRKHLLEDFNLFKKLKINDEHSECPRRVDDLSKAAASKTQMSCSYMSKNRKRMREEEVILAAPCKRTFG